MSAYAVAHLRTVVMGPAIVEYLERIDATLTPFEGQFLVHGSETEVLEGSWPGHLIVVTFPDREQARAWYRSAAYQEILHLRTDNSEGDVILVDGVSARHRATDIHSCEDIRMSATRMTSGRRDGRAQGAFVTWAGGVDLFVRDWDEVIHGDRDASAPLELAGRRTAALIPGARLDVYEGAPHGLYFTHKERPNRDLASFAAS